MTQSFGSIMCVYYIYTHIKMQLRLSDINIHLYYIRCSNTVYPSRVALSVHVYRMRIIKIRLRRAETLASHVSYPSFQNLVTVPITTLFSKHQSIF